MYKVAIIGYGYWGPNIARNFFNNDEVDLVYICDKDKNAKSVIAKHYKNVKIEEDYKKINRDPDIDIVAIVTPTNTHYEIAKDALLHNKHILITKPFTSSSKQALELIEIAENKKLLIAVDHTFLFTGAVKKIKEIIDNDIIGDIYYYDSRRVNLGLFQGDVNVIWDLAPHDFSIIDYIIKDKPIAISAHGVDHFNRNLENIAYITMYFEKNIMAHINLNWLSPVKIRTTLIGGSKKMLVYNDIEPDEKIRIYEKGISINNKEDLRKILVEYRSGDAYIPKIDSKEALSLEIKHFIECIKENKKPINDSFSGLRVVKLLESADQSLRNNGEIVRL